MFARTLAILMVAAAPASAAPNMSYPHPSVFASPAIEELAQSWSCQPRKTCGKIRPCEEAVWYLYNCSWSGRLDGDGDGAPCEKLYGSNN